MKNKEFVNTLNSIVNFSGDKERQVEAAYNAMLKTWFSDIQISNPYKCDGYFETEINSKKTRVICEYKFDYDFTNSVARAKVLAQVLFYLKKFEQNGQPFPNVILIGDVNECFVVHSNSLLKYLDFDGIDWSKAASAAGENADLIIALSEDTIQNSFVFNIDKDFTFETVYNKICDYATNVVRLIKITEHNIDKVFSAFQKVVKERKVSANDMVALFFGCITDQENYYLHPTKKNVLVANGKTIRVDANLFTGFMRHFSSTYLPKEKAHMASISDRLIEDTNRRRKGEFYTPTMWVDTGHELVTKNLGQNWRDEYVVVDCCCGSKNLTRDYKFSELYLSTLEQAELDISKQYNPEAKATFTFDFLNESDDELFRKAPGLKVAFEQNKKILFLINPPYGRAGAVGGVEKGSTETNVRLSMQKEDIEGSEFIKQFLWRITDLKRKFNLTNLNIAAFTKPTWLIKPQSKNFRKLFLDNFSFVDGFMFCAAEFADVSAAWGITFNLWKSGTSVGRNDFVHKLCKSSDDVVVEFGTKTLYNFDGINTISTSDFVTRNLLKKKHDTKIVTCKNIKTMDFVYSDVKIFDDYLANVHVHANDISNNGWTSITNTFPFSGGGHLNLTKSNIFESCIVHSIRQELTESSWINDKDMYNMNVNIPDEFKYDCFINSVFGNYCCGLTTADGHKLKNEFFWMSKSEIEDLANDNNLDELYADVHTDSDRFVYNKLQTITLSPEAQAVLDKANDLVRKSMKYRKLFDAEHPEHQLTKAWDAGWYQTKAMLKQYMPNELKEFNELKKKLADKMRPMVYELGFLKS